MVTEGNDSLTVAIQRRNADSIWDLLADLSFEIPIHTCSSFACGLIGTVVMKWIIYKQILFSEDGLLFIAVDKCLQFYRSIEGQSITQQFSSFDNEGDRQDSVHTLSTVVCTYIPSYPCSTILYINHALSILMCLSHYTLRFPTVLILSNPASHPTLKLGNS